MVSTPQPARAKVVHRRDRFNRAQHARRPQTSRAVASGLVATIGVALLFRATTLDIDLQALAYDPHTSGWPYAKRIPWSLLHDLGTLPGLALALASIALITASFLYPTYVRWRFQALYVVTLTALGPGLITNLFGKVFAGRPRPKEIVEFGGSLPFLEPFELGTPGKGFSFLCGHCSMGFLFVAFFFLLKGRNRWLALAAAVTYGLLLGVARVAGGAHFPSDVALTGTLTFTLAAAIAPLAHIMPRETWERRVKLAVAAVVVAFFLLALFSLSAPINRERVHTWTDVPLRAATHETMLSWNDATSLMIDVERGDVHVRIAPQHHAVRIISTVEGFGFPGSDGRAQTERTGGSIVYRHRLTGFLWEARVRFDVTVASGIPPEVIHVKSGDGKVIRGGPAGWKPAL